MNFQVSLLSLRMERAVGTIPAPWEHEVLVSLRGISHICPCVPHLAWKGEDAPGSLCEIALTRATDSSKDVCQIQGCALPPTSIAPASAASATSAAALAHTDDADMEAIAVICLLPRPQWQPPAASELTPSSPSKQSFHGSPPMPRSPGSQAASPLTLDASVDVGEGGWVCDSPLHLSKGERSSESSRTSSVCSFVVETDTAPAAAAARAAGAAQAWIATASGDNADGDSENRGCVWVVVGWLGMRGGYVPLAAAAAVSCPREWEWVSCSAKGSDATSECLSLLEALRRGATCATAPLAAAATGTERLGHVDALLEWAMWNM